MMIASGLYEVVGELWFCAMRRPLRIVVYIGFLFDLSLLRKRSLAPFFRTADPGLIRRVTHDSSPPGIVATRKHLTICKESKRHESERGLPASPKNR